jgi:tetratricopeptide (TPR) repeat protein
MSSSVDELVKKAVDHRENGRIDAAIIAARHATTLEADDANTWWQLALALNEKDGARAAIPHFKKTTELAPSFAYGWHRLGLAYKKTDQLAEAVECWERAVDIDDDRVDSMRELLVAYSQREEDRDENRVFEILKLLDLKQELHTEQICNLGNEYYKRKDYYKAIVYFRRYAAKSTDAVGFFNLGLAYRAPEIGQDVDAIDAWRRALARDGSYDRAKSCLDETLGRQLALSNKIQRYGKPLIDEEHWYSNYLNPFELLNLAELEDPWDFDVQSVQKAKKALLQEIDLEDGKVEWMPGLKIDRSRAIRVVEELNEEWQRYWHHLIYQNKGLLNFLSRGKLDHFFADAEVSPIELLEALDDHAEDFAPWLSERFVPQYNLALVQAIERKDMDAVNCLIAGRRWVVPENEDKCFEGAHRQLAMLLQPLRDASKNSEKLKPSVESVKQILDASDLGLLLSVLPLAFQKERSEAAALIRIISVDAHNHHGDAELATAILEFSKPLALKSPSLWQSFQEDMATLNERIREQHERIREERKHEASLTFSGANYSITREGVSFGHKSILVKDLETIRWGISVSRSGVATTYDFSMFISSRAGVASISWSMSNDLEKQEELFKKLVDAAFAYLIPPIFEKVQSALDRGETQYIGRAPVSKAGITFTIEGWFRAKQELCPWHRLRAEISNGELHISDLGNHKAKLSMSLRETNNAFILYLLIKNFQKAEK